MVNSNCFNLLNSNCLNNYFRDLKSKKILQKRQSIMKGDDNIIISLATGCFGKTDMYNIYFDKNICEYREQTKMCTLFNMIT